MGTNYYVEEKEPCECCGRPYERLHIGKSSGGWCFALHVIPEIGINDLKDWKIFWQGKKIFNEYAEELSEEKMLEIITQRKWSKREKMDDRPFYKDWNDFHEKNHSEFGPNELVRSKIDGKHCIGHGEGTWDLITGEFS